MDVPIDSVPPPPPAPVHEPYKMEAEAMNQLNCENAVVEAKPKVDLLEAQGALAAMALTSVAVGEYLVVLRSQFDVFITGEPYPALMVLYNLTSGKVLTRIWNQGWGKAIRLVIEFVY